MLSEFFMTDKRKVKSLYIYTLCLCISPDNKVYFKNILFLI